MAHRQETVANVKASEHLRGQAVVARCLDVLNRRPSAVVVDIDGTISEIAPTPDTATVSAAARAALEGLIPRVDLVSVITGRAAADGARLVAISGLLYVGNHGLEWRVGDDERQNVEAIAAIAKIEQALNEIRETLHDEGLGEGVIFENKTLSASIHYRLARDSEETGRRLLALSLQAARAQELRVTEGRFVVELRPMAPVNKGTALAEIVALHDLKGMIFLGDDVTDVDGFRALRRLRESTDFDGIAVAVATPETNPVVLNEADAVVGSVEEAIELLAALGTKLPRREPF